MKKQNMKNRRNAEGSILALIMVMILIMTIVGMGLLTISYGVRTRYARLKNETMAMLAAEAGYEKAIFWMSQQGDILGALNTSGASGSLTVGTSTCIYSIQFNDFAGSRPIFRVSATGTSGSAKRSVDVLVVQDIGGWAMAKCRIPSSSGSLTEVYFVDNEIISMPLHINKYNDSPDVKDIYISGSPSFTDKVGMGENRYTNGGSDKYNSVMGLFQGGILFNQPAVRITDEAAVQSKLDRFRASTKPAYTFTPVAKAITTSLPGFIDAHPAVQIEFYKDPGTGNGMLRITNNCTVISADRPGTNKTWDYKVVPGSGGENFMQYNVYAYHYRWDPTNGATPAACKPIVSLVTDTYVSQTFGTHVSDPGGQIFVYGDVVLGSDAYAMVLKGKLTIVAQRSGTSTDDGHIWIADKLVVDGTHYASNDPCRPGMPTLDNPNVLGLIAQGVVKVIDPGQSGYDQDNSNKYPGPPPGASPYYLNTTGSTAKHVYVPVADSAGGSSYNRYLPDPMVIEAAITVGGGGFGAENVAVFGNTTYGGRRENGESLTANSEKLTDQLVLRGSLCEVTRGIVGATYGNQSDGFQKNYYVDERLLNGILPGDIWFSGRYIPAPDGWKDYRPTN